MRVDMKVLLVGMTILLATLALLDENYAACLYWALVFTYWALQLIDDD